MTVGEDGEGADEGGGFESSGCGKLFRGRVGLTLFSESKTCGRHLARCFAVEALASSSEREHQQRAWMDTRPKTYSFATGPQVHR